jgi:hypothetical protein
VEALVGWAGEPLVEMQVVGAPGVASLVAQRLAAPRAEWLVVRPVESRAAVPRVEWLAARRLVGRQVEALAARWLGARVAE